MKWKQLPIGQFVTAKKHAGAAESAILTIYNSMPDDAEAVLAKAQEEWSAFLALGAEEVDPGKSNTQEITLAGIQGMISDFFLQQVGPAQK